MIRDLFRVKPSLVLQAREPILSAAAEAEDFDVTPVLQRYREETGVDQSTARRHWRELLRFLIVVGYLPSRGYGMYGPVDTLWHSLVLHTELYKTFCERQAGRFIHHQPGSSSKGTDWRSRYLQFLIDYRLIFDAAPPDDVWPLPVVSSAKLPKTTTALRQHHVKAMARIEKGGGRSRGAFFGSGEDTSGRFIIVGAEAGGESGEDGGGCGGGGCGGGSG